MELPEKLEEISRFLPGIPGYQSGEKSRETDKTVRLHLTSELNHLRRVIFKTIRIPSEKINVSVLPLIDRTLFRMEELAKTIKYASRGYRNFFNNNTPEPQILSSLYNYDLRLFQGVKSMKLLFEKLAGEDPSNTHFKEKLEELEGVINRVQEAFEDRHEILSRGAP